MSAEDSSRTTLKDAPLAVSCYIPPPRQSSKDNLTVEETQTPKDMTQSEVLLRNVPGKSRPMSPKPAAPVAADSTLGKQKMPVNRAQKVNALVDRLYGRSLVTKEIKLGNSRPVSSSKNHSRNPSFSKTNPRKTVPTQPSNKRLPSRSQKKEVSSPRKPRDRNRISLKDEVKNHNANVQALMEEITTRKAEFKGQRSKTNRNVSDLNISPRINKIDSTPSVSKTSTMRSSSRRPVSVATKPQSSTQRLEKLKERTSCVASPGGGIINKSAMKRYTKEITYWMHLYNLFNQTSVHLAVPKSKTKLYLGRGNNHPLIQRLFNTDRGGYEDSISLGMSNVVWTQQYKQGCTPTLMYSVPSRVPLKTNCDSAFLKKLEDISPDGLVKALEDLKLFKFETHIVRASFSKLCHSMKIIPIIADNLNLINHINGVKYLTRKYQLAKTIIEFARKSNFDPFLIIPKTYFIEGKTFEKDLEGLVKQLTSQESAGETVFPVIVKPGENANRGVGISMAYSEAELKTQCQALLTQCQNSINTVVQSYIKQPLLFKGRKFDIRCYALLVKGFNRANVFWYQEGYIRTSSYAYDLDKKDNLMVHLTNEAVQVKDQGNFGAHEPGNKLYYPEMEEYCSGLAPFKESNKSFLKHVVGEMRVV